MRSLALIILVLVVSFECQKPVEAGPSGVAGDQVSIIIANNMKVFSRLPAIHGLVHVKIPISQRQIKGHLTQTCQKLETSLAF
ncbi:unnamed protein product [Schistosoma turkestanicum]|nr:unnamed protein product [Schistosoma turkestanicum]